MKKWIWIPILLVLFIIGDRVGALLLDKAVSQSEFRYSRLYTDRAKADIVFIGNSRGLNYFQPFIEKETGKSTLNLSYNALPSTLAKILLQDYLDRYGAPETLVIEATCLDRENPDLINDFKSYIPYSNRLDSLIKATNDRLYWGTKVAHLSRFGGEVYQRAIYYLGKSDRDWLLDRKISKKMIKDVDKKQSQRVGYTLERIQALVPVVKQFEAAGTDVHFIINPYYPAYQKLFTNFDSLTLDIQKETGIQVLNYSKSISGDNNFGDYQHLNKAGAEVFLERLIKDLDL